MERRKARCACGKLTIAAEGDPRKVSACHCQACQHRTGSAFGVAAFYDRERTAAQGPSSRYTRTGDSGSTLDFHFCPTCGSTVFWYPDFRPGLVAIALGCFEGPVDGPSQAVYEEEAHAWAVIACVSKT